MSVPPLFTFQKNSFFSIGLPVAKNTFYQLPEKELKNQIKLSKKKKGGEKNIPSHFIVKGSGILIDFPEAGVLSGNHFDLVFQKMIGYLKNKPIWIRDSNLFQGNKDIFKTRHISEDPQNDLFILKNFSMPSKNNLEDFEPEWYFINTPNFFVNLEEEGIEHSDFTVINFVKKVVLIGGIFYSEKLIKRLLSDIKLSLDLTVK
jgi:ATP-dependent phosphoenolpyruvate carboxykinase